MCWKPTAMTCWLSNGGDRGADTRRSTRRDRPYLRLMDCRPPVCFHSQQTINKESAMLQYVETDPTTAIRPFQVSIPESDLADLRRRIAATRLPEKETVADFSQGVPLATVQKL